MKLVVNSEGVYLTKVGECFCVKKDKNKQEISAKKVEHLLGGYGIQKWEV